MIAGAGGTPTTVVVGRRSNLSRALERAIPGVVLVSGADVLAGELPASTGDRVRLVLNAFQPATGLRDLSDPVAYVDRAIGVTARILGALEVLNVSRLVYTSSASVYGDNIFCAESDPLRPMDLHASLKVANEHLVREVCRARGVPATVARVFNMYGRDDQFSVVSKVVTAARSGATLTLANGGNAIRDFIHVDDVVTAYRAILDGAPPDTVNVASGRGVSIAGMLDTLRRTGVEVRTADITRDEIKVSTANVGVLGGLVDVSGFARVEEFVLREVAG